MAVSRRWAILVMFFLAAAANPQQHAAHAPAKGPLAADPNWADMTASMEKMHVGMGAIARTGDADTDFVHLMLPHHQGAIDMAKAELLYGKDPAVRRLAQEIVTDQKLEIEVMQLWLEGRAQRGGKP